MLASRRSTSEQSLVDLFDRGQIVALPQALELVRSLASEIAGVHRRGEGHGGIEPAAVLLDEQLRPRLMKLERGSDFGRRSRTGEWTPPALRDPVSDRVLSQLEGSLSWSSLPVYKPTPDSALEIRVTLDPRQRDVYALGALLCRLLTGRSADAYLRSPRVKGSVSPSVQRVLDRALTGSGKDAIVDADEFLTILDTVSVPGTTNAGLSGETRPAAVPQEDGARTATVDPMVESDGAIVGGGRLPEQTESLEACEALPFKTLGHYEIVSRLGEGGMGEVYLGYEQGLDRWVAVKVLPAKLARDADLVRRFRAEATAAARLVHPNIIQIYYIGEDAGHYFFAMQHVEGMSLAKLLSQGRRLSIDEALAIIDEVLSGLAAAHHLGFVHRDIKPANILLDGVHRRALLADFGLVKSLEETMMSKTSTGVVLGTVDYIAPEQGQGKTVDCRSDLYSLGVVLYQVLAGRLPFVAKDSMAVIYQHVHEPLPPIREFAPDVPEPLAAIVEKLLAKNPDDRYQSAAEALADVRAFRAGQPVSAEMTAPPHRDSAGPAAGALPVAVERQTSASTRSRRLKPELQRRRFLAALGAAALPIAAGACWFALTPADRRPRWLFGTVAAPVQPGLVREFANHPSELNGFALTPDEELLIVADRTGKLHLWDFQMAEKRRDVRAHGGPVRRVVVSRNGEYAITASADQTLKLWDLATWKQVTQFNGHLDLVTSVAEVPGRNEIVSCSTDCTLIRWKMDRTGKDIMRYGSPVNDNNRPDLHAIDLSTLEQHVSWIRNVLVHPSGQRMISAGNDGVILIWNIDSGNVVDRLIGHPTVFMSLALAPDGTRLLAGGYDKVVSLWDVAKAGIIRRLPHDSGTPASLAFAPDGERAVSGGADGLIHYWDLESGQELHTIEAHEGGTVSWLQFTRDGKHVVSSGEDRAVRLWRLPR